MQETGRFIVRTATGYDFGHLAPRDRGVIGSYETIGDARAARDAYIDQQHDKNNGAAYAYATIIDRDDEHAVVGFGRYGNGQRIMGVRALVAVCKNDDVLFRGSLAACEKFRA